MRFACSDLPDRLWLRHGLTLVMFVAGLHTLALAQGPPPPDQPEAAVPKKEIYDTKISAKRLLAQALRAADRDNQRVLVMFGGNWCGWCHKLHDVFTNDRDVAQLIKNEYQLALVDVGRFDKHMEVAAEYAADLKQNGVPFLVVLDADGKVLTRQETGSLEAGSKHDPNKVKAFLEKWKAAPLDAQQVLAAALLRASAENKHLFLRLSAPWCTWCHRLGDFLSEREVAKIFGQDYIDVKIDVERMKGGEAVAREYRQTPRGGIPWFAIIDARGQVLATSDGPKGNVGFPVADHEVAHFISMLKSTRRTIPEAQLETIKTALQKAGKKFKN